MSHPRHRDPSGGFRGTRLVLAVALVVATGAAAVPVATGAAEPSNTLVRSAIGCDHNDAAHQGSDDRGCPVAPVLPPAPVAAEPPPPPPPPLPIQVIAGDRAPVLRPVLGKYVVISPVVRGVRVRTPGSNAFSALSAATRVPVGTTIDATAGRVKLTSAADDQGGTQAADFTEGAFVVNQRVSANPVTELVLTGALPGCGPVKSAAHRRRRVWGSGHGHFRTRGRYASATARGTVWLTEDRCDGTYVKVKRSTVIVRDRTLGRAVAVHAGESYLAPNVRPKVAPAFTG